MKKRPSGRTRSALPAPDSSPIPREEAAAPSRAILFLAFLFALAPQLYLWPHVTDDAYISFRYARNLAAGTGLVFNPGEFVEGFSNPLWTIVLAGIHYLTDVPLPDIARTLGLVCTLGTLIVLWRIILRYFPSDHRSTAPLVFSLALLSPGTHVYATAGLEGPLLGFLLALGVAFSLDPRSHARSLAALSLGLAGITRPEGPLYALLWYLATLRPSPSLRETSRGELARASIVLFPIAAWQAFRLSYYGNWLPNTAIAKLPGVFDEFTGLGGYVTPWLVAAGGPFVLFLWFFIKTRNETLRTLERMAVALAGANAVFVFYAGGDWMSFGRFIAPVWPVVALVLGLWLCEASLNLRLFSNLRFRRVLPALPIAAIVCCSLLAWHAPVREYVENRGITMLMRGTDQRAVGKWIAQNIHPQATIATIRLGGIGYEASANSLWDWLGLTDAEEASHIRAGRPGSLTDDPIVRRRPDVIAAVDAPANWGYRRSSEMLDLLRRQYTFILSFPQGTYGTVDIWIRRDGLDRILSTRHLFTLPSQ